MKRLFTYKHGLSPEYNIKRLKRHLAQESQAAMVMLARWLGDDTEITGEADAENLRFTMTFAHKRLGTLGRLDLIFESERVLPREVDASVCIGACGVPDRPEDVDERRVMMWKIYRRTRNLLVLKSCWRILYYRGGELLESRDVIDDNMARVKGMAYRGSPPGSDMIKLVPPKGKGRTLIRTAKKQWVHEG
ncbi:MAG: hypothetical protein LBL26_13405 [Peptococcaceae bacterium]|jgi:hypothetical protein|nr:hypothetical protein [Peptococcaceae bacterium]